MKKLLNTLFITTQESYLACEGENILVRHENQTRARFPIHTLQGVVCFGHVNASPYAMRLCAKNSVALTFLTENGRLLATIHGETRGNVLLRREQYRRADDEVACLAIAAPIIAAKITNQRTVLQRALRDHGTEGEGLNGWGLVAQAEARLQRNAPAALQCPTLAALRGVEGDAAETYFSCFDRLIIAQKDAFQFGGRNRRPPLDPVNALLSFVYTLLAHDVAAALEANGLDPFVGFLHRDRPGRRSLALDMMEELRPQLADRLVLSMINRRQVTAPEFKTTESGAVEMIDKARKAVLVAWQERKREEIRHPFLDEKIHLGLVPHCHVNRHII